ncbi:MAG: hypothetical protein KBC36_04935, partial [Spirochaetia bacterium]|nr:hypothetical protein [Spirochaetia bacterium]
ALRDSNRVADPSDARDIAARRADRAPRMAREGDEAARKAEAGSRGLEGDSLSAQPENAAEWRRSTFVALRESKRSAVAERALARGSTGRASDHHNPFL